MRDLLIRLHQKDLTTDEEAWQNLDKTFDKYLSECFNEFENELTSSERVDFVTNTAKYYYAKYGSGISEQMGSEHEEIARKMAENLEDFLHIHEDEIEAFVEEFANSIDREELDELMEQGSEMLKTLMEDLNN